MPWAKRVDGTRRRRRRRYRLRRRIHPRLDVGFWCSVGPKFVLDLLTASAIEAIDPRLFVFSGSAPGWAREDRLDIHVIIRVDRDRRCRVTTETAGRKQRFFPFDTDWADGEVILVAREDDRVGAVHPGLAFSFDIRGRD